ncbi:MAG: hypothetical protein ACYDGN_14300 [Acidimicrobiales bacterium]
MPADKKLVGSSGEHLVCAVLAQLGWAAALTRDGLARTDLLAVDASTGRAVTIQVKTTWVAAGKQAEWTCGLKDLEPARSPTEWYVMVKLEGKAPAMARYFVVPRDHVAAATWIVREAWATDPDVAKPRKRRDRWCVFESTWKDYEDRWGLLRSPAGDAPVLLSTWCQERCQEERVGLRSDHPWFGALPTTAIWGAAAGAEGIV